MGVAWEPCEAVVEVEPEEDELLEVVQQRIPSSSYWSLNMG